MKPQNTLLALFYLASTVQSHGFITSPPPRLAGSAMAASCGAQVYSNQASDNYGNIQGELQVAASQSDYNAAACDIWLCKGYKYADNTEKLQSYTTGQTVPIVVDIRAPHTGTANVSIIEVATNTIIGSPLISWDVYASNSVPLSEQKNNTNFEITIPSDLGSKCTKAGDCVIQWWWDARSIDQTYEACVDFTVGSSDSASVSSVAPASSSAAALSSAVVLLSTSSASPTSVAKTVTSTLFSVSTVSTPVVASSSLVLAPTTLVTAVKPSTSVTSVATATPTNIIPRYYQCGGINYTGATTCVEGTTCTH